MDQPSHRAETSTSSSVKSKRQRLLRYKDKLIARFLRTQAKENSCQHHSPSRLESPAEKTPPHHETNKDPCSPPEELPTPIESLVSGESHVEDTQFHYEPLNTPTSIRLVKLPGTRSSDGSKTIQLEMKQFELSGMSKDRRGDHFYALSYVWGDPKKVHTINLNGQKFGITKNLMFFLRRKWPYDDPHYFWIDAICINQHDNSEKSEQISRMREIYEHVTQVHAELGPAPGEDEAIIGKMMDLSAFFLKEWRRLKSQNSLNWRAEIRFPAHLLEPALWTDIGKVFSKPWWSRVWVMQEATASSRSDTLLFYGDTYCLLADAVGCIIAQTALEDQKLWPQGLRTSEYAIALKMDKIQSLRKYQRDRPLLEILRRFRGLLATDPRDILYAALNIANDTSEGQLRPNYRASVANVYRDLAVYYLNAHTDPFEILAHCGDNHYSVTVEPGYASWIPRWDRLLNCKPFIRYTTSKTGFKSRVYDACRVGKEDASSVAHRADHVRIRDMTLALQGFQIDRIVMRSDRNGRRRFRESVDIVDSWLPADGNASYILGGTKMDAFWSTIVAVVSEDRPNSNPPVEAQRGFKISGFNKTLDVPGIDAYHMYEWTRGRRLATSKKGYMALVSHQIEVGDLIYCLFGGSVLYVLRPKGDQFWFICEAYVHGLMDGEAMEMLASGERTVEEINII